MDVISLSVTPMSQKIKKNKSAVWAFQQAMHQKNKLFHRL